MAKRSRRAKKPPPDVPEPAASPVPRVPVEPPMERDARKLLRAVVDDFHECLVAYAVKFAPDRPLGQDDIERAYSAFLAPRGTKEWAAINRRRVELIAKKVSAESSLDPAEEAELVRLQAEADRRIRREAPLALEVLREMEQSLRERLPPERDQSEGS